MRVMVLDRYDAELRAEERPVPQPGPGQVRVRIRAAALCASDVHAVHGAFTSAAGRFDRMTLPVVLGHQIAGTVDAVGDGVPGGSPLVPGQPCVVYCYDFCGRCLPCLEGRQNVCRTTAKRIGFEWDGGFAEHVVVPRANVIAAPGSLGPVQLAVLPDAATTAFRAVVRRAAVRPGERVAVIGVGALGIYALRWAFLSGARVVGIDRRIEGREQLAQAFGSVGVVDSSAHSPEEVRDEVDQRLGGPPDVVIDGVGTSATVAAAVDLLREGGRLLIFGVNAEGALAPADARRKGIVVRSSLASTVGDLQRVLALADRGVIEPVVADVLRLEDVNTGLERLERGEVVGRLVLEP